jgi:FSR family fosmidomycin resistance protein-like MFS transporter
VFGTLGAAWPLIRDDLGLTYAEIGLALAVPGLVGSALDPVIGVLGDTGRRRAVMALGGLAFAVSVALTSTAVGFWTLLAALMVGNPASGALVSLAQATLMDLAPADRERNMARWTLAGSFG